MYKEDLEHASLGCFCGGYPHNHLFGLFMNKHSVEAQVGRLYLPYTPDPKSVNVV
jgi:hypothetical protein